MKRLEFWIISLVAKESSLWTCECSVYLHFLSQLQRFIEDSTPEKTSGEIWHPQSLRAHWWGCGHRDATSSSSPALQACSHSQTSHAAQDLGHDHPGHLQREQISENQAYACALNKRPTILLHRRIWRWLRISLESEAATNKQRWIFFFFLLSACSYITTYCLGKRKLKGICVSVQAWTRYRSSLLSLSGGRTGSKTTPMWLKLARKDITLGIIIDVPKLHPYAELLLRNHWRKKFFLFSWTF